MHRLARDEMPQVQQGFANRAHNAKVALLRQLADELGQVILVNEHPLMDPKNDVAFKLLFGQPGSAEILMAFLNALLHRTGADRITAIEFADSEFAGNHKKDRGSRLDVYVRTDAGEHINIEIQIAEQDIAKRTLFYWATIFKAQIRKNAQWTNFPQTITINIVDFAVFASTNRYHTSYHVCEDVEHFRLSDVLEIHFIELPKFRHLYHTQLSVCLQHPLERWLLLLDANQHKEIRTGLEAIAMSDPTMGKALDLWEEISRDPDNWAAYISRDKELRDLYNLQKQAETAFDRGKLEGELKGKLETAKAMLEDGLDVVRVSRLTGIPVEELERLQEEHH